MAKLLLGKPVADQVKEQTAALVAELKAKGAEPCLAVIRVGERPDDLSYEAGLKKTCAALDVACRVVALAGDVSPEALREAVQGASGDPSIHGILLFSPLPKHLPEKEIRALIHPDKDVDCLTMAGAAKIFAGEKDGFPPCTPAAVMELLAFYGIELSGKNAVVLGRSLVVGKPLAMLLLDKNATVTICHSRSRDLPAICRGADLLIAAVGKAKLVKADYVSEGQVVVDVGINADPDREGQICGDVDFDAVEPKAGAITPVPRGVGSVTNAILLRHTALACKKQTGL